MKKIIWGLIVLLVCFAWYSSAALYYENCPSSWKVYWWPDNWFCWNCKSCTWTMFGNTWFVGCGLVWYRWCCGPWWVVYKTGSDCCYWTPFINGGGKRKCCARWKVVVGTVCKSCESLTETEVSNYPSAVSACNQQCDTGHQYHLANWLTACCEWMVDNDVCYPSLWQYGINLDTECLINWQCSLNVYKVMWIRQEDPNPTVLWFFQDITLATTTAILWTLITVALVLSWLYFAICSVTGKEPKKAKEIIKACFGWLLLVMSSYAIIRLVQFLATAWS